LNFLDRFSKNSQNVTPSGSRVVRRELTDTGRTDKTKPIVYFRSSAKAP